MEFSRLRVLESNNDILGHCKILTGCGNWAVASISDAVINNELAERLKLCRCTPNTPCLICQGGTPIQQRMFGDSKVDPGKKPVYLPKHFMDDTRAQALPGKRT